jgi:DNA (cytosine-5)-methyltransferase 1
MGTGGNNMPMAFSENQRAEVLETPYVRSITSGGGKPGQGYPAVLAPTLTAANNPSRSPQSTEITSQVEAIQQATSAVRRLTPLECERLMGWPDNWTAQGINGTIADSHRYRMCGNGVVSNITKWIGRRLPATNQKATAQ